jgi:hypothetical protein
MFAGRLWLIQSIWNSLQQPLIFNLLVAISSSEDENFYLRWLIRDCSGDSFLLKNFIFNILLDCLIIVELVAVEQSFFLEKLS